MNEEIDRSGQGKWTAVAAIGFILLLAAMSIILQGIIGVEILTSVPNLSAVFVFSPLVGMLTGTLFGFLRKRATKINVERLEYSEEVRDLDEFGLVYHKGDYDTTILGGHPAYGCGWILVFVVAAFTSFGFILCLNSINGTVAFYTSIVVASLLYLVSFIVAHNAAPISSPLVNDPLDKRITKYLSKMDVLKLLLRCDRITSIIVRYREGIGQALKVITDIRVCAVTNTQPHLEIEITIDDMERIGPEYTFRLSQSIAQREESKVSVSGKMAILTLGEENMRSFLRLRYDFGLIRAKWALGSDDELCELVHAMLKEISRYEEFIILDTASSELQADYGG